MKITCLKDGSYNSDPPSCEPIQEKLVPAPPVQPRPSPPALDNSDQNSRPNFPRRVYPKIKLEEDTTKPIRKYKKKVSSNYVAIVYLNQKYCSKLLHNVI